MQKLIYKGIDAGIYSYGGFERFMRERHAEHIRSRFDMSDDLFQIWMLNGVLVHYIPSNEKGTTASTVRLHALNSDMIDGVERIILDGAEHQ